MTIICKFCGVLCDGGDLCRYCISIYGCKEGTAKKGGIHIFGCAKRHYNELQD